MNENRGYWYLFTGVILGLVLGITYAWGIAPIEYVDTSPESLRADFKDEYRSLIALSYRATGNLERARARLALLGDPDPAAALGEQAQRLLAANASTQAAQVLANLAEALQKPPATQAAATLPPVQATEELPASTLPPATARPTDATSPFEPILEASETPSPTATASDTPTLRPGVRTATATRTPQRSATPIATVTPKPSLTPTATPGLPFELIDQSTFCDPLRPGLLQVNLSDAAGKPASGIEISITWFGGDETFYTGLKPELGFGYADFVMAPGVEYALSMSNGITRISGLQTSACTSNEGDYPGGIRLELRQP